MIPVYVPTRGLRDDAKWCRRAVAVTHTWEEQKRVLRQGFYSAVVRTGWTVDSPVRGAAFAHEWIRQHADTDRYCIVHDNVLGVMGGFEPALQAMSWVMDAMDAPLVSLAVHFRGHYAISHSTTKLKMFLCRRDLPRWRPMYAEDTEMCLRLMAQHRACPRYFGAAALTSAHNRAGGSGNNDARAIATLTDFAPQMDAHYRHLARDSACGHVRFDPWHNSVHSLIVPPPDGLKTRNVPSQPATNSEWRTMLRRPIHGHRD